jgi:O-antigen/teichoic acid export membrane protein
VAAAAVSGRGLRQLASESLVYGLSSALTKLAYVILVPLYTRVFTPGEYGLVALVTTVGAAATVLAVLGLDSAAHRWFWDSEDPAERKRTLASWAWCQALASLVLAAALVLAAGPLSRLVVGTDEAAGPLRLLGAALPLTGFATVTTNWLRMRRRPWATLGFNLAVMASGLGLTVLFVLGFGWGVRGVFAAQLATGAWTAALAGFVMRDWLHPRHFAGDRLREMLTYALPLIPAGMAVWVLGLGDRLFVQRYASTSDVGVYQVGFAVASVVALGTQAFQQAWGPFSFSIHRDRDAPAVYAAALLAYLWLACFAASAVGMLAPEILRVVATAEYAGAHRVAALLAFGYVATGLGYIAGLGLGLARKTAPMGAAVTLGAGVNLVLNFSLTPRMGMDGAALAALLSQGLVPVYLFHRAQRVYPLPYRFGPAVALVALGGAVTWLGLRWTLPLGPGLALKAGLLSLFIPALFAFGIVSPARAARLLRRRRPGVAG